MKPGLRLQSSFYNISDVSFNGRFMQTMFSARDSEIHRVLRTQVSQLYSMSNMRKYESYVDEATALFVDAMNDLQGQTIDLAEWVQWYVHLFPPFLLPGCVVPFFKL